MIYVISKATFGSYNVRDIQCNANWCECPYSDYALIPDDLVDGILATQGYCDITLNSAGTEVASFTALTIPSVPEECGGTTTVLSVNGVSANSEGAVTLTPDDVGAQPAITGLTNSMVMVCDARGNITTSSTISTSELGCLDGVSKNIQTQLDNKVKMELLWSNASSGSTFAEQTIELDLSEYDFIVVRFRTSTGATSYVYALARVRASNLTNPVYCFANMSSATGALNLYTRSFSPFSTGVIFTDALGKHTMQTEAGGTDNTRLVPTEIYGVKGVVM